MSVAGISSSDFFVIEIVITPASGASQNSQEPQSTIATDDSNDSGATNAQAGTGQSNWQSLVQDFRQLGHDLQSGNLSAAQSAVAALEQYLPQSDAGNGTAGTDGTDAATSSTGSTTSAQSNWQSFIQGFQQLGQDLQSGNLSAAQSALASIEQYLPQSDAGSGTAGTAGTDTGTNSAGSTTSPHSNWRSFIQGFQQLGQDLQSGNLSAAQSALASLEQYLPQSNAGNGTAGAAGTDAGTNSTGSATNGSSPFVQEINQLSQELQAGNLSAAQQDYTSLQQDVGLGGHHHGFGGGQPESGGVNQLLGQLGQALQSGNLSTAMQLYSGLTQDLSSLGVTTASPGASTATA